MKIPYFSPAFLITQPFSPVLDEKFSHLLLSKVNYSLLESLNLIPPLGSFSFKFTLFHLTHSFSRYYTPIHNTDFPFQILSFLCF